MALTNGQGSAQGSGLDAAGAVVLDGGRLELAFDPAATPTTTPATTPAKEVAITVIRADSVSGTFAEVTVNGKTAKARYEKNAVSVVVPE